MCEVKFEYILANHCAPVLMGTKLSNLISLSKAKASFDEELLEKYKDCLLYTSDAADEAGMV